MPHKLLLITGRLAEPTVRKTLKDIPKEYDVDILVLPIDVAALMTNNFIVKQLIKRDDIKKFDFIMVSGAIQDPLYTLRDTLKINIIKGPRHAVDIPFILKNCNINELSPDQPADDIIKHKQTERLNEILNKIENTIHHNTAFYIGDLPIVHKPPPIRVISEITETHKLSRDSLLKIVHNRILNGADIISIGFEANNPKPDIVKNTIRLLKKNFDIPIAIDSVIPSEIKVAAEAGADLIMSLEGGNIDKVYNYIKDIPTVIIPYNSVKGIYPKTWQQKIRYLTYYIKKAMKYRVKHIIADPILEPINTYDKSLINSLLAYYKFKEKYKSIPMLMGIGNVTELIDADSIGVNALLTHIAHEIGVSIILVVEKSAKCQRSTYEASLAAKMSSISYIKQSPPKDIGINLLILKDKRRIYIPKPKGQFKVVEAYKVEKGHELDRMGIFNIRVNRDDNIIEVYYIGKKGKILIKGKDAESIRYKILELGLISTLSHALYLGTELMKAEIALKLNKNYVQDEPLFDLSN